MEYKFADGIGKPGMIVYWVSKDTGRIDKLTLPDDLTHDALHYLNTDTKFYTPAFIHKSALYEFCKNNHIQCEELDNIYMFDKQYQKPRIEELSKFLESNYNTDTTLSDFIFDNFNTIKTILNR